VETLFAAVPAKSIRREVLSEVSEPGIRFVKDLSMP
jgi:hypothetical protein